MRNMHCNTSAFKKGVYFYIKSLTALTTENIAVDLYGIYDDTTSSISKKADTATINHPADSSPSVLYHKEELSLPYYSSIHYNHYYEVEGSLTRFCSCSIKSWWRDCGVR